MLFCLLLLVVTVAVVPLCTRVMGRNTGFVLALVDLALAAYCAPLGPRLLRGQHYAMDIPWVDPWDIRLSLHMDSLSWFFTEIALGIGAIVMLYSARYFEARDAEGNRCRHTSFFLLMSTFTFSMVLLVTADNLILLFLGWELTSLMSFMLIGRSGHAGEAGSLRTLFLTFIGGLFFLTGMVVMSAQTSTSSLSGVLSSSVWVEKPGLTTAVAIIMAIAGFTKAAQFPFHLWLPEAMAAETPVSAYLHAATVVKAGIYILLRFSPLFRLTPAWQTLLSVVGMGTAIMGALFALQKTDLKKLLAYSTVSQLGWIIATIGVGTHAALTAALFHTFAHALFKSGLFMSVGTIQHITGTRDIRRLPSLWRYNPGLFAIVIIGACGMAGIPPTLGFVSKEAMLHSLLHAWGGGILAYLLVTCGVVGAALTVAYCFRIIMGGFVDGTRTVVEHGTADPEAGEINLHHTSVLLPLAAALPAVAGLPLYFLAPWLGTPFSWMALDTMGPATPMNAWATRTYGPQIHPTSFHLLEFGPVLALSACAIALGVVLTVYRKAVDRRLRRPLLPRTGAENLAALWRGMRFCGSAIDHLTRSDSPARHIGAMVICLTMVAATFTTAHFSGHLIFDPRAEGVDYPIDLVVLGIVLIACTGALMTPSRMATVVLLSAAGTGVTIQIFALGAPDVGLTQLLVEILTTVMYMLVLRRLPRTFTKPGRGRHVSATIIAVTSGLAAAGGVLAFTGRRGRSELAEYFLDKGPRITHGTNVTNTILVEFRAMDTYGEMAVLGITGLAVAAVLLSVSRQHKRTGSAPYRAIRAELEERLRVIGHAPLPTTYAYRDTISNSFPLRKFVKLLSPIVLTIAAILFWRGHHAPGGGFIAGLIIAVLIALTWLSLPEDRPLVRRAIPDVSVAVGLTLSTLTGLLGFFSRTDHSLNHSAPSSAFLSALHWDLPLVGSVPSAVFFDLGITLCLMGAVLVALDQLGSGQEPMGSPSKEEWPPYDSLHVNPHEEGPPCLPYDDDMGQRCSQIYRSPVVHIDVVSEMRCHTPAPQKTTSPQDSSQSTRQTSPQSPPAAVTPKRGDAR